MSTVRPQHTEVLRMILLRCDRHAAHNQVDIAAAAESYDGSRASVHVRSTFSADEVEFRICNGADGVVATVRRSWAGGGEEFDVSEWCSSESAMPQVVRNAVDELFDRLVGHRSAELGLLAA